MCGRFARIDSLSHLAEKFNIDMVNSSLPISYNIPPGTDIAAVISSGSVCKIETLKWGIPPKWKKDSGASLLINARSETLLEKSSFKNLSRCAVPANGYFEWAKSGQEKLPYYISRPGNSFFMAGIYDSDVLSSNGSMVCAIVTSGASQDISHIHNRMPLILTAEFFTRWIDPDYIVSREDIVNASVFCSTMKMNFHRVSKSVNSSSYNSPDCIVSM
jgi:putative SOS response-associated peptidase YedK